MEAIRKLTALGQKHFSKLPAAENGRSLLAPPQEFACGGIAKREGPQAPSAEFLLVWKQAVIDECEALYHSLCTKVSCSFILPGGLLPGIFCTAAHNVKKGDAIWKAHSESCSVSCWNGFRKMDFYQKTPI